jgi:hypothetical protein
MFKSHLTKYLLMAFAVIALAAFFALATSNVRAADAHLDADDYEWHYDTSAPQTLLYVVHTGGGTEVDIPGMLDGYTALHWIEVDCFNKYEGGHEDGGTITKVLSMPSSVYALGEHAFYGNEALTDCAIGTGVWSIGYEAFGHCKNLTALALPAALTDLKQNVVVGDVKLTTLTVHSSNSVYYSSSNVIYNKAMTTTIMMAPGKTGAYTVPSTVTTIGASSLSWALITSITIPTSVTTIKEYAMAHCYSLTTVTIPNSVTSLEKGVFGMTTKLVTVNLPNSITVLTYRLFTGDESLVEIDIPASITTIEGWVFHDCVNLTDINFMGLTAPTNVETTPNSWLEGVSGSVRGHAYDTSGFPAPGLTWRGLVMGDYYSITPPVDAPVITSTPILTGTVNVSYSYQVVATGEDITYSLVTNATGLIIDPDTGLVSGTPTGAGTFYVEVTATNGGGTDVQNYTLTVVANPLTWIDETMNMIMALVPVLVLLALLGVVVAVIGRRS